MPGRPKRKARLAAAKSWGSATVHSRASARPPAGSSVERLVCPPSRTAYVIDGRTVCVDRDVQEWLRTGNGRGSELTRNGTPAMARADLEQAVRRHIGLERKHADHFARHGVMDSKFETRSKLVDDDYGQGLWLELFTSTGRSMPKGVIAVSIDHG